MSRSKRDGGSLATCPAWNFFSGGEAALSGHLGSQVEGNDKF